MSVFPRVLPQIELLAAADGQQRVNESIWGLERLYMKIKGVLVRQGLEESFTLGLESELLSSYPASYIVLWSPGNRSATVSPYKALS